jgi:actin-like ATPase involved in cell morphogenesis
MLTCGIDLGTSNSCIVVVDGARHRIIADEQGTKIFPSVVYIGRDGKPVVGHAAKNRLGEQPAPVATIKRKMGSLETVDLGGKPRTPVEVSAMILGYLKELAERQAGDIIDRAVVTVPAYFNHIQRQQTDQAARLAGFREVVTLLEPVAAALAYSLQSEREQLRVFVYDMGGGTFDATVLEKDGSGGLTVLSFGGDPYLGGDDIDARVAQRILDKLKAQGFALDLDLRQPDDASRYQRIKFFAELAKKQLTDAESTQLVRQGLFEDQQGATVDLDVTLTRAELEECSRDLVQRTIDASLEALRKDGREIAFDSIDEVIMVGGMSRMPLVQRMLAEAFGRQPKIVDPDLIVGLGAAHKSGEVFADQDVAASGLRLELRYGRQTDQSPVRISGAFDRVVRGHTVYLVGEGLEQYENVDGSDRFSFDSVPLAADAVNTFTLSVEDADDTPVLQRDVKIRHDSKVGPILTTPGSVVTKPIAVGTLTGAHVLFPENTALPYSVSHTFETADQSGMIVAPIFEVDREVQRLEIRDIPRDLPIGTAVIVEVSILADYRIEVAVSIPAINRDGRIVFEIKPLDTSKVTPAAVTERLAELAAQAKQAVEKCPSVTAVEQFEFRFSLLRDEILMELREIEPKAAKMHEKLASMELLIARLPSNTGQPDLKPTFEEFSTELSRIVDGAIERQHPRLADTRPKLEQLREMAKEAWSKKDAAAWRHVNQQVQAIARLLQPELSPLDRALGMAAWIVTNQVPELRKVAGSSHAGQIDAIEQEAIQAFVLVQAGGISPEEAANRVLNLYQEKVKPLSLRLGLIPQEAPVVGAVPEGSGAIRAR